MSAGSIFVHELSHLLAMRTFFTNSAYIGVEFSRFRAFARLDGVPELLFNSVSYSKSMGLTSAAGPISDNISIALSSLMSWKLRNPNKKISLLFANHAACVALNTFSYAIHSQISNYGDFKDVELWLHIPQIIQTAITGVVILGVGILQIYGM